MNELKKFEERQLFFQSIFKNGLDLVEDFRSNLLSKEFILYTGIKEIDDTIVGIFRSSLVVIAGETGRGKSLLAGNIAFNTMKQGKRVCYFDFENDDGEFFRRQVAREMNKAGINIRHIDLRLKEYYDKKEDEIEEYMQKVGELFSKSYVYNSTDNKLPTIDNFIEYLSMVEMSTDLVVVDHLHYFDFEKDQSDTENIGRIMRALRGVTKEKQIPIIIVAHIRKKHHKGAVGNDDLYGSSNIAKEAETVIILSKENGENKIAVTKNRNVGIEASWYHERKNYDFINLHPASIQEEDFST